MNSVLILLLLGMIISGGLAILLDFKSFQKKTFGDIESQASLVEVLGAPVLTVGTQPSLKRALTFIVPSHFRIDESAKVKVEYFEAITVRILGEMSSFIYEKMRPLRLRHLPPNAIEKFFMLTECNKSHLGEAGGGRGLQ